MGVLRRDDGATAVEFALVLPFLLLLLGFILLGGFYALFSSLIGDAARQGARAASIRKGNTLSSAYPALADVEVAVKDALPSFVPSSDLEVSVEGTAAEGARVVVTVRAPDLPFLTAFDGWLNAVGIEGISTIERSASLRRQ